MTRFAFLVHYNDPLARLRLWILPNDVETPGVAYSSQVNVKQSSRLHFITCCFKTNKIFYEPKSSFQNYNSFKQRHLLCNVLGKMMPNRLALLILCLVVAYVVAPNDTVENKSNGKARPFGHAAQPTQASNARKASATTPEATKASVQKTSVSLKPGSSFTRPTAASTARKKA